MSAAKRIQRKRTKGWRMPEGAVYVGRPSIWGNPYKAETFARWSNLVRGNEFLGQSTDLSWATTAAVERFRKAVESGHGDVPWPSEIRLGLHGQDLVCWCPLDQPCHADVLLEIANGGAS